MKKNYSMLFCLLSFMSAKSQLFQQSFANRVAGFTNSALVDANYVSITSPSNSQFTYMASGHSSATVSVPDATDDATNPAKFKTVTSSTSSVWAVCRNVGFATNPTAVQVSFDLNVIPGSSGSNPKWFFYLGNGFANSVTTESSANVHSGFAMRYTSSTFFLRSLGGTESSAFTGSTNRTIVFTVNNTGSSLSYTPPGGGTETLANDTWDLWVGTTKIFDDQAATTASQALNNFKFGDLASSSTGRASLYIDDFTITDLSPVAPVAFSSIAAFYKQNQIFVNWKTLLEINVNRFEIQKSVDGIAFNTIEVVKARGNGNSTTSYSCIDINPAIGNNYYRIKSIENDGSTQFSSVVKLINGQVKADFVVAPNPVKDKNMNIQLTNLNKGIYTIDVIGLSGQKIKSVQVNHDGGSSSFSIKLPSTAQQGMYKIAVQNNAVNLVKQLYVE